MLTAACGPSPHPATGTETTERIASATMGKDLILRIRTPPDVDTNGSYPLVIQLDPTFAGLEQYAHTVGLVSHYAGRGEWPEAVVVGVDFDNPYDRMQDYDVLDPPNPAFDDPENADRFYNALRDDVLPHVQATLPVDPSRQVLVGHSMGAVFAWYAALRHRPPEPPLFAGYVAADGGCGKPCLTLERWHAENADDLPVRLYATRADLNGPSQALVFEALQERLVSRGYPSLQLQIVVLDTDHGGALVPSYEQGLAFTLVEAAP